MQVHQHHQEVVDENRSAGANSRSKEGSNSQALIEQEDRGKDHRFLQSMTLLLLLVLVISNESIILLAYGRY
jgi:hypothetical protein